MASEGIFGGCEANIVLILNTLPVGDATAPSTDPIRPPSHPECLSDIEEYISAHPAWDGVVLDGDFTLAQLRRIVDYLESQSSMGV